MKKKILILCDAFPPAFAPRMGYLCKNMIAWGWEPTIITEYLPQNIYPDLAADMSVKYIHYYHAKNRLLKKAEWFFIFIADYFFDYKERIIEKEAQKEIDKHDFSVLLTSSYRTYPLVAAGNLSVKNNIPLITDLRDIIEQYTGNEFIDNRISSIDLLNNFIAGRFKKKLLRSRNKVLGISDFVTTVSEWHVETLEQYNKNIRLIYNGYDPDLFYPKKIRSDQFKITYTGRIISLLMRDPSLLFEAVSELAENNIIAPSTFRIRFYTDKKSAQMIGTLAAKYKAVDFIDYFDYVTAPEIPAILNESSILLLLTNESSNDGPKGVMTTKFFEYLAVEKPILCVRNDGALLEKAIRKAKAGLSAKNKKEVIEFLTEKYEEWKVNGYTHTGSDRNEIEKYSRSYQAKQFVSVFESIPSNNK